MGSIEEIRDRLRKRAARTSWFKTPTDEANDDITTLLAAIVRVRELHAKVEHPTHGCCGAPQLCNGHAPECRSSEHPIGGVPWPCSTLRALGLTE